MIIDLLTGREIRPEFERSRIIFPGQQRTIEPKRWDGSVVVHAPLAEYLADELFFARESAYRRVRGLPPMIRGGAATAWAMTNTGRTSLENGTFDIDTDSWKMALFLSTSDIGAAETTYAGVTNEHAAANGYSTGGIAVTLTLAGTTTVTTDIATDPVWTAAGGSIVARFAVLYEVAGNVLVYCTLDSTPADVTATDGNTLTVAAHASGVYTLA